MLGRVSWIFLRSVSPQRTTIGWTWMCSCPQGEDRLENFAPVLQSTDMNWRSDLQQIKLTMWWPCRCFLCEGHQVRHWLQTPDSSTVYTMTGDFPLKATQHISPIFLVIMYPSCLSYQDSFGTQTLGTLKPFQCRVELVVLDSLW